uniref:Uncharacterized protein LOC113795482 n=1 Tax=Dermatophagoides pteronyssinus TaxID=6956 RepID=A0A6P6Y7T7_DERPT|nr:uncharacterized protein LOC113795482 [Dermatophagoides pteronyssinus]
MDQQEKFDIVHVKKMERIDSRSFFIDNGSWENCDFYFLHISNFWPKNQQQYIPYQKWPENGSDYALAIRLPIICASCRRRRRSRRIVQQNETDHFTNQLQNDFITIPFNHISDITSQDECKIVFTLHAKNLSYTIEFSNDNKVNFLLQTIVENIHCFVWDPLTNHVKRNYFVVNQNSWIVYDHRSKIEKDEYDYNSSANYCRQSKIGQSKSQPPRPPTPFQRQLNMDPEISRAATTPIPSCSTANLMPQTNAINNDDDEDKNTETNDEVPFWDGDEFDDFDDIEYNYEDLDLSDEDVDPPEPFHYESGDDSDIWN